MRTKKLKARLSRTYGTVPDPYYFHGDMEYIRAYYDFRRETGRDQFLLDDITWNDLDMDRVFQRINPSLSTSGEQYLYYMLRSPAVEEETFSARQSMIGLMARDHDLRLQLQVILARLGCTRRADLCREFYPAHRGPGRLLLYLFLFLLVPLSALSILVAPKAGIFALIGTAVFNAMLHEYVIHRIQRDFDTVNYSVSMIFALRRIQKLHHPDLDARLEKAYGGLDRLRSVIRTGGVSTATDGGGVGDIITTFLLLDLITYEFLKNKLGRCHEDVFAVHEGLGQIDAAIAIASYRKSLDCFTEPVLDFHPGAKPHIHASGMVHPLLKHAVPNDLCTDASILITGSNASGKSTFLKTVALCAILAQGICTCPAQSYHASVFRIYSSMALSDSLLSGESYYIVETKSLKRILDQAVSGHAILCVIDEILRGTNTVERIAASSTVLEHLSHTRSVCVAATHDIELCELLKTQFQMFHFEETIAGNQMVFDYALRVGPASSRNAINLLKLMGFDDHLVENAHARANAYLLDGIWK